MLVLTWAADRHAVVDDLAGLQQQLDLLLRRVFQVEVVQFDADLLHGGGLGDGRGYTQSRGGAAQHDGLTHTRTHTGKHTVSISAAPAVTDAAYQTGLNLFVLQL